MVERNPWYTRVEGPFPERYGCVGVKPDGGGSMRGRGLVGPMKLHHAVMNRDDGTLPQARRGQDVNEVEGASNTPLHFAAYEGWCRASRCSSPRAPRSTPPTTSGRQRGVGVEHPRSGTPSRCSKRLGADTGYRGRVIVPEHIPKVKDFYELEG